MNAANSDLQEMTHGLGFANLGYVRWSNHVNFSVTQWLAITFFQLLISIIFVSLVQFHAVNIVLEIPRCIFYLTILFCVNAYVRTFDLSAFKAVVVVLAAANAVYFAVTILWTGYYHVIGQVTTCSDNQCTWINGRLTLLGLQQTAFVVMIRLFTNVLPVLTVLNFNLRGRNSRWAAKT